MALSDPSSSSSLLAALHREKLGRAAGAAKTELVDCGPAGSLSVAVAPGLSPRSAVTFEGRNLVQHLVNVHAGDEHWSDGQGTGAATPLWQNVRALAESRPPFSGARVAAAPMAGVGVAGVAFAMLFPRARCVHLVEPDAAHAELCRRTVAALAPGPARDVLSTVAVGEPPYDVILVSDAQLHLPERHEALLRDLQQLLPTAGSVALVASDVTAADTQGQHLRLGLFPRDGSRNVGPLEAFLKLAEKSFDVRSGNFKGVWVLTKRSGGWLLG